MSHVLNFRSKVEFDPGRPGIDLAVHVTANDRSIEIVAKLDTGASHCVFRRDMAASLGLDLESGEPLQIGTFTGSFSAFGHPVVIEFADISMEAIVYFATDPAIRRNVLGRRGFIDRLRLGIVDYDGVLYASGYNDSTE